MRAALDWLSRVVMLVLAGLVTLSIIGAIASIPSGSIGTRIGLERAEPSLSSVAPGSREDEAAPAAAGGAILNVPGGTQVEKVAAEPPDRTPADWLEAITYALIALAGLAALGCLLIWRGVLEQRRIAEALASLSLERRGMRSLSDEGA